MFFKQNKAIRRVKPQFTPIYNSQFTIYNEFTLSQFKKYDLEERTAKFGESVIDFCRKLNLDPITRPIVTQLIRSATSIGANYMEANSASSKKDFANKIFIAKKEAQETKHWLRMLARAISDSRDKEQIEILWRESQELTMIFQKITTSLRAKLEN